MRTKDSPRISRAERSARPTLALAVQYAAGAPWLPARARLRRWVRAALEHDAQITLRFVDDTEGRTLNRDFRGKDYATNVLTFVYESENAEPASARRGAAGRTEVRPTRTPLAGDIVLCVPVIEREAAAQGKARDAHCAHLTVHGVLHLQGYDHEERAAAHIMEAREIALLARLGFPNPYA